MKLLPKILGLLMVCQAPFLSAGGALDSCDMCCMDLSYDVFVDYIYWKVCRSDLNRPTTSLEKVEYINPSYESGYRVGGRIGYECWDIGAKYTYYNASTTRGFLDNQGGTYKMDLDMVDIEVGYTHRFRCHDGYVRPVVGAKLLWTEETENFVASAGNKSRLDNSAYGLYFGVEGMSKLFECWIPVSLVGRVNVGILESEFDLRVQQGSLAPRQNECIFTPFTELFVGLDFSFDCFSCFDAGVQLGYEVQSYYSWRSNEDASLLGTLGLGGLTLRIGLGF